MGVTVHGCLIHPLKHDFEQFGHVLLDGFGIWSSEGHFEGLSPTFLGFGHPALAAQFAVAEVDEEVGILVDGHVVVHRVVLAVFEGFKTIDNDVSRGWAVLHHVLVEQDTMSGESSYLAVDGFGGDFHIPGRLSIGHAADDLCDESGFEVWSFLPVGSGESLGAEAAFAGFAGKPLDTVGGIESFEGANFLVVPGFV
jgi:hypothetical protein